MNELLDFQLSSYIDDTFTHELAEDIQKAFEILYSFELQEIEIDFINLITSDSVLSQEDIQDQFIILLNTKLDYIINQHKITLTDNVSLSTKIEILSVLLLIMYLEDYSFISIILESDLPEMEKFATILEEYSHLMATDVLTSISELDPNFMIKLKEYADSKADVAILTEEDSDAEVVNNLKLLKELHKQDTIGYLLLKDNIKPNLTIEQYMVLIDDNDYFNNMKNIDILALDIFSLLLLSRNSINNLLLNYRKYNTILLENINTIAQVEAKLIQLLSHFLDYKKIKLRSGNDN